MLQKITLKTVPFRCQWNSVLAEFFRKSAKFSEAWSRKTAKKRVFGAKKAAEIRKNAFLFHWHTISYKENAEKVKKSARGWMYVMEKFYFCNPKRQRYGTARARGLSTGECSLKEWKNVANTQEEEFEIRKRWGQDRQKIKDINYYGEFDPGSGWTLAAGLIHASRTVRPSVAIREVHEWRTGA